MQDANRGVSRAAEPMGRDQTESVRAPCEICLLVGLGGCGGGTPASLVWLDGLGVFALMVPSFRVGL